MIKSKSEAKRIAIQKGKSIDEVLRENMPKPKCFYCADECGCHIPDNKDRITCGCPVHGILTRADMKLTPEEVKKVFLNYSEIEEAVERIVKGVYRIRHPYTKGSSSHHGGPNASYEHFYVEGDNVEVSLDTGCCGSYDSDYIVFPLAYLYTDNWYELEKEKVAKEKEKKEELLREQQAKRKAEAEEFEKKQYKILKAKYETKKRKPKI